MPDPLQSLTPNPPANACIDPDSESVDLACHATPVAQAPVAPLCSEPEAASGATPPAVKSLVDRFAPDKVPSFVPGGPDTSPPDAPWSPSDNNAYRTTIRNDFTPYAAHGQTEDGNSVYAGVALLKAHSKLGLDLELGSASAQAGAQSELQVGVARGTLSSPLFVANGSASADLLTARANVGIHNDDDSVGANIGAVAELAGLEATVSRSGWSGTFGLSASVGAAASIGIRDADNDGRKELCAKVSIPVVTVGLCAERFW